MIRYVKFWVHDMVAHRIRHQPRTLCKCLPPRYVDDVLRRRG